MPSGPRGGTFLRENESLSAEAGQQICGLPQVSYGRSREIIEALTREGYLSESSGIKCIDLEAYRKLGFSGQEIPAQTLLGSAGLMINILKTREADPDNIYLALTPKIQDSTLIHQIAHILDYLKGSKHQPGTFQQMSLETGIPSEHLDHSQEFGYWLNFLKERFQVTLDAEDAIVAYLFQNEMLLKSADIKSQEATSLAFHSKKMLDFMFAHKADIDALIQKRSGYIGKPA
ncbi:MAG TPA: hypothetical protein VK564_02890 [Thermodesulfobacteriota bacterium]|nr:hypothetical protein [Thermodesulfobacteriota bacterium]